MKMNVGLLGFYHIFIHYFILQSIYQLIHATYNSQSSTSTCVCIPLPSISILKIIFALNNLIERPVSKYRCELSFSFSYTSPIFTEKFSSLRRYICNLKFTYENSFFWIKVVFLKNFEIQLSIAF